MNETPETQSYHSVNPPLNQPTYPAEVQGGAGGHGPTHAAELAPGHQVPVAEGGGLAEAILQLGGQRGQRRVAVLPAPLWVTPGGGGPWRRRRSVC